MARYEEPANGRSHNTSSSSSIPKTKLRHRDFFAAACALILSRLSYLFGQGADTLGTNIDLSFYTEFKSHALVQVDNGDLKQRYHVAKPVPFDLDGDGIVEGLVAVSNLNESTEGVYGEPRWGLKVLDLKPLHRLGIDDILPLHPETIFTSKKRGGGEVPVKIITGQIVPDKRFLQDHENLFERTLNDGLPSVATVWSNGDISLHSITANTKKSDEKSNAGKEKRKLEFLEMWNVNAFDQGEKGLMDFVELAIMLEPDIPAGKHGALVIASRYRTFLDDGKNEDTNDNRMNSLYFALDAFTGEVLWKSDEKNQYYDDHDGQKSGEIDKEMDLKSTSSEVRRRARTSQYTKAVDESEEVMNSDDCIHHFRHLMFKQDGVQTVLPHLFWHQEGGNGSFERDSKLVSGHFDRKYHRQRNSTLHENGKVQKTRWLHTAFTDTSKMKAKTNGDSKSKNQVHPNVAVFHNRHGVNVISLRNGKEICHLTFQQNTLYADINNDAVIEQIQIQKSEFHENEFIPCTVNVKSGIKIEKDFGTIPLCSEKNKRAHNKNVRNHTLSVAPPLLVENSEDVGKAGHDMVFAISHGFLKRYSSTGKLLWTRKGEIPGWNEEGGINNGYLDRIEFTWNALHEESVLKMMRPIVLFGDQTMALYSSESGRFLDKVSFPQMIVDKPILADLNGDGTTDIIITTVDGIWGYCVSISSNGYAFLRIVNIFLVVFIVTSFFVGYMEHPSMRRSTDP